MIGVGIIGYGYWGPNLSRCVADAEGCFVAAIGDDKRSPFVFNEPPDEA